MNAIRDHIRNRIAELRRRGMFHIEVTTEERSILETALNHHIGSLLSLVGLLAQAHGAGAPCVETARREALVADRLSDKLKEARWKLMEVAR